MLSAVEMKCCCVMGSLPSQDLICSASHSRTSYPALWRASPRWFCDQKKHSNLLFWHLLLSPDTAGSVEMLRESRLPHQGFLWLLGATCSAATAHHELERLHGPADEQEINSHFKLILHCFYRGIIMSWWLSAFKIPVVGNSYALLWEVAREVSAASSLKATPPAMLHRKTRICCPHEDFKWESKKYRAVIMQKNTLFEGERKALVTRYVFKNKRLGWWLDQHFHFHRECCKPNQKLLGKQEVRSANVQRWLNVCYKCSPSSGSWIIS